MLTLTYVLKAVYIFIYVNYENNRMHRTELFKIVKSGIMQSFLKPLKGIIFLVAIEMRSSLFFGLCSDPATFV